MSFNTLYFIILFLPLGLIPVYLLRSINHKIAITYLLIYSIVFYYLLEKQFLYILIGLIVFNYILAKCIIKCLRYHNIFLGIAIMLNIGILLFYKYFPVWFGAKITYMDSIILPIGLSFIVFQLLSYIIDVYRDKIKNEDNSLFDLLGYILFFPKVMQGPIVRYNEFRAEINKGGRIFLYNGIIRFIIGLTKKIIISTPLGYIADKAFSYGDSLTFGWAWLGAVSYTLQIYYDFSGYTDMAIGIGNMLGFNLRENFKYPYISKTPSEFWRRWHITLSEWFKEYIYIPLGGNRVSVKRNIFNLFIVWVLTGLWHGATINFLIWGLYWFALIIMEKYVFKGIKLWEGVKIFVNCIFIIIGWVIFKTTTLHELLTYIRRMIDIRTLGVIPEGELITWYAWLHSYWVYYVIAIIFCIPVFPALAKTVRQKNNKILNNVCLFLFSLIIILLFVINIAFLVKGAYSPFIYHKF